jgi:hypothetical protein
VLSHPALEQSSGPSFGPLAARFSHQPGLALLRSASSSPDDAGLSRAILYGSTSALRRLQQIAREWKHLHSPDISALRLRAYPQGSAPTPGPDEWLISKRSVDLLLSFQEPANE